MRRTLGGWVSALCLFGLSSQASQASQALALEPSSLQTAQAPADAGKSATDGASNPTKPAQNVPKLSLAQAMQRAVEQNPDITRAKLATVSAQIDASRARLDRFTARVDLSAGDTAGVGWAPETSTNTSNEPFSNSLSYGLSATASIPLYTGGADAARVARSDLSVEQSELDQKLIERDLRRAVYQSYANIQSYDLRIAAAKESLSRSREALTITQAKLASGLAAPIEVNRFQVDVLSQEQTLMDLEQSAYSARQDLLQLLQLSGEQLELADDLTKTTRKPWTDDVHTLTQQALSRRQELESLRSQRSARAQDIIVAKATHKPQVYAEFGAQAGANPSWINTTTFDAQTFVPSAGLTAGVTASWNLFNFGQTRDQVRKLEVADQVLEAQLAQQSSLIEQSVKTALNAVLTLNRREAGVHSQLELARDNLNIIQTLYGQGSATLLDLFEAQGSYRTALIQEATFRIQQVLAELELRWTLGETFE